MSTLDTIFLVFILFGAFSVSVLWVDFFYRLGEKLGWSKKSFWGSFYLASVFTIFFIIAILALQYFKIDANEVLSSQL